MTERPVRLTVLLTHPVQYLAPWFRHIAAHCATIDLTVLYAARPDAVQQATGFDTAFEWDIPLLNGYHSVFAREHAAGATFDSGDYRGVDVEDIADALAATRPDVVLIPGWHSVTYMRALRWCNRNAIPVLWRGDTHGIGRNSILWRLRTRYLLHRFQWHLSVGLSTRAYLQRFGIRGDRIFASPHHVDNAHFQWSDGARPGARAAARANLQISASAFVVLSTGKLGDHKRPLDIIDAAAKIDGDVIVVFAGDGPAHEATEAHARSRGVEVRFTGFINQSAMPTVYAMSDVAVVAGEESWGLVMNEALAAGIPVVANDGAGGTRDLVIPGETGERFAIKDTDALSRALRAVREGLKDGRYDARTCTTHVARYSVAVATTGLVAACDAATRLNTPRILVLAGGLFTATGMERSTFEILRALRSAYTRIHCSVNNWAPALWPNGPHLIMTMAERVGSSWSTARYMTRLNRSLNPVRQLAVLHDVLRTSGSIVRDAVRIRATHVFIPEFTTALRALPALVLLRLSGRRVVLKLPIAVPEGVFYGRVWRWLLDPVVSTYVANSAFTEASLFAHGIGAGKTARIGNIVVSREAILVASPARIATDRARIVFIGQIIQGKGVSVLLDAVAECAARGIDIELDVLGSMTGWALPEVEVYREQLRARADRDDLSGRIHFAGFHEDVRTFLAGARLLCCPSMAELREAFGMVVIEAKDAGIPAVVFPSGGLPELIEHGVDGWVCTDFTARSLADGICAVLELERSGAKMGEAARRSMSRYGYAEFRDAWLGVFSVTAKQR